MTENRPLYYWDSCIFIAWLQNEQRADNSEIEGVNQIVSKVQEKEARMVTSILTQAEVLKCTLTKEAQHKFENVLRRRNVIVAETDFFTWNLTMDLREYYQARKEEDELPTLTVPDAIHLATAIRYEVDEFLTFDKKDVPKKRRGLIPLSGNVAGHDLKIVRPLADPNLFTGVENGKK